MSDRPPSTLPSFTPTDVYLTRHGCHIQNPTHLRCIRVRRFRRRRDVHRAKDFLAQHGGAGRREMVSVHSYCLWIAPSVQFALQSARRSIICVAFSFPSSSSSSSSQRGNGTSCFSCCRPFLRVLGDEDGGRGGGNGGGGNGGRRLTVWLFSLSKSSSPSSLLLLSSASSSTCLVRQSFLY